MLFGAQATSFSRTATIGTRMHAAVFCNPIAFAHTLMANTFALLRAIVWTENRIKINKM